MPSLFYTNLRIHYDVLWIFKRKARFRYHYKDEVISELQKDSYQVETMYRPGQYEPNDLFGGKVKRRDGQVVEIGKLLNGGFGNHHVARQIGVDVQTVSRIRNAINEYRGIPFMCRCGKVGGHNMRCEQLAVA